jgi:hypothetical protein
MGDRPTDEHSRHHIFQLSHHIPLLHYTKLVNNQFLNFHGQPGARLNLHQSVYGENRKPRSRLMHFLSLLLFSAPDVHLQALDRIWVDYIAKINLWEEFIRKLNAEWQEFVIIVGLKRYATRLY